MAIESLISPQAHLFPSFNPRWDFKRSVETLLIGCCSLSDHLICCLLCLGAVCVPARVGNHDSQGPVYSSALQHSSKLETGPDDSECAHVNYTVIRYAGSFLV